MSGKILFQAGHRTQRPKGYIVTNLIIENVSGKITLNKVKTVVAEENGDDLSNHLLMVP